MLKYAPSFLLAGLCASWLTLRAQETYPVNGIRPKDVTATAFTHATIWVDPDTRITDATLVVEKGRVVAVGTDVRIPAHAVVEDLRGKTIYPAFMDLYSDYGIPRVEQGPASTRPQLENNRKGAFGWNEAIRADTRAASLFSPSEEQARQYRDLGFGIVLTHRMDGIARGTSALVELGTDAATSLILPDAAAHFSFQKGTSQQSYPGSLMGSIALLRQTGYDARWYAEGGSREERNLVLEAWNEQLDLPQVFDAGDKWNCLRADRIGDELGIQYILRGGGDEYQRASEIKATGAALILPLQFPAGWDVRDPFASRLLTLTELKHWEMAPSNPALLHREGIPICFTLHGLEDKSSFHSAIREVHMRGLPEADLLRALTSTPARLLRQEQECGALRPGMRANFTVWSSGMLDSAAVLLDTYVSGTRFSVQAGDPPSLEGTWQLRVGEEREGKLVITGAGKKPTAEVLHLLPSSAKLDDAAGIQKVPVDTLVRNASLTWEGDLFTLLVESDSSLRFGNWRLSGSPAGERLAGQAQLPGGKWVNWEATLLERRKEASEAEKTATQTESPGTVTYPFTAFGWTAPPAAETLHFRHATIWTCEAEGKIVDGEVILHNGRIAAVGRNLDASAFPGVRVIDATGKHITPGIIDEHSHIALESVNEPGQTSSAEVREASVIFPEDINIYRQLSGGVTAAQLLHGSANPIGGQSALVKMRWGATDEGMLIRDAPGFIKFALGENVKQSNWGDQQTVRFPQTRMGVEQVYFDHFIRAREYGEAWKKYRTSGSSRKVQAGPAPRRDLELETLLEILEHKRFITCHSYQQGEINMLMHVADSLGFRINTFTHILEGYKIADKMKAHGAGGSSFSDWWAYKTEVKDAIPHNGALLWSNGVTVAFNSDDAEMARRLNQEAAKAVKYGGVPEEEALKFVTLNPARLLHLDDRMGSIRKGKDADIVVWDDHPLSIYARAEQTYVDGICYYDRSKQEELQASMEAEKARLIGKLLKTKGGSEELPAPVQRVPRVFHCDTTGSRMAP